MVVTKKKHMILRKIEYPLLTVTVKEYSFYIDKYI